MPFPTELQAGATIDKTTEIRDVSPDGRLRWFLFFFLFTSLSCSGVEPAAELFQRLTGAPLLNNDPRLSSMRAHIAAGQWGDAARTASEDDRFFHTTLRNFSSALSNRKESPFVPFSDFDALILGVVRDDTDARELLTGNYRYQADATLGLPTPTLSSPKHYRNLEAQGINLRESLVKRTPQWDEVGDAAGLLTTYQWASEHFLAGTNRRSTEFAFREFLCAPIKKWRDFGQPDFRIRRDVPRTPSGSAETFQTECRSCHALLDGMSGAFANFDFQDGSLRWGRSWIAPKMNQNRTVYPKGYPVTDSSWINLATEHHNQDFGWRTSVEGYGVNTFGRMLAESKGFSRCMTSRVFFTVCRGETPDSKFIETLAEDFETKGYLLRSLFERVAIHCTLELK